MSQLSESDIADATQTEARLDGYTHTRTHTPSRGADLLASWRLQGISCIAREFRVVLDWKSGGFQCREHLVVKVCGLIPANT